MKKQLEKNSINYIMIKGAKENNLKDLNIDIPKNKLVVITGVSGSGKSTLAFDTINAEGQRKYMQSLSAYARQFLGNMEKPKVDSILGLSPTISISQNIVSNNPRSTVGTVTEIYDYLRLLYANIGIPYCPICGKKLVKQTIDEIVEKILKFEPNSRLEILSHVVINEKGKHEKILSNLLKEGFIRVMIDDIMYDLSSDKIDLDKNVSHNIYIVVDRIILKEGIRSRVANSSELALKYSKYDNITVKHNNEYIDFSTKYSCVEHNVSYEEISASLFSFNTPLGACNKCNGLGMVLKADPNLVMPDKNKTIYDGIEVPGMSVRIKNKTTLAKTYYQSIAKHYGVEIYDVPIKKLPKDFLDIILYGSNEEKIKFKYKINNRTINENKVYEGVIPTLERRHRDTTSDAARKTYELYMNTFPCTECNGGRLKKEILSIKVHGLNIYEVTNLNIVKLKEFLENLKLTNNQKIICEELLKELKNRVQFLIDVGLGYLNLSREARTLSGGEAQRIKLATQIGSKLTGVLYILDEPSIGLHQRDNDKLLNSLKQLRDIGNSLIVVEHDEDTMYAADHIIDIGPNAGETGGHVVAEGTVKDICKVPQSITGRYLSGKEKITVPENIRKGTGQYIKIYGAKENNLKNVSLSIPLGKFITVTGVSGSGKSTLINQVLYPAIYNMLYKTKIKKGNYRKIEGLENIDRIIRIDQKAFFKTSNSNPATYIGVFDEIRSVFSQTKEAKKRGYKISRFSFNVSGGRCEECKGQGKTKIEMHFLPDVYVECKVCKGRRYNKETLEVKFKGLSIGDVLNLTVDQALKVFEGLPKITKKLQLLNEVGLGYIRLGQSAKTLSGGEGQRIKLAYELSKRNTKKTLYILDEPSTGLHIHDIKKLINILQRLAENNTIICIEHNLDIIKVSDYIIDLGPEGGDKGGEIIFTGTLEEIIKNKESYTGIYLKKHLEKHDEMITKKRKEI